MSFQLSDYVIFVRERSFLSGETFACRTLGDDATSKVVTGDVARVNFAHRETGDVISAKLTFTIGDTPMDSKISATVEGDDFAAIEINAALVDFVTRLLVISEVETLSDDLVPFIE